MRTKYRDRRDAGRALARALGDYVGRDDVVVLALPRGGVPVAYEVAEALAAPLDVFVVRKLGLPWHEELAMGAIASGGGGGAAPVRVLNDEVIAMYHVSDADVAAVTEAERQELERRERAYRGDRPAADVRGKTIILVDDGLATGSTMRAAVAALRHEGPARVVVAVPISAPDACDAFRAVADDIVCARMPEPFVAVGLWYDDFTQTEDDEVHALLDRARRPEDGRRPAPEEVTVRVRVADAGPVLEGTLTIPASARGLVLFAHGSGSSRHSPRNRFVAGALQAGGFGTLLVDLLTPHEELVDARSAALRFDVALLADRLVGALAWLAEHETTRGLGVGLFGASTGGGAALVAAAREPERVAAVVSRGGRPDLAGDALPRVRCPTLLVVGGRDEPVIALNEQARGRMRAPVRLEIVPGASHLFEEPGTLEAVARLATDWFGRHVTSAPPPGPLPGRGSPR